MAGQNLGGAFWGWLPPEYWLEPPSPPQVLYFEGFLEIHRGRWSEASSASKQKLQRVKPGKKDTLANLAKPKQNHLASVVPKSKNDLKNRKPTKQQDALKSYAKIQPKGGSARGEGRTKDFFLDKLTSVSFERLYYIRGIYLLDSPSSVQLQLFNHLKLGFASSLWI